MSGKWHIEAKITFVVFCGMKNISHVVFAVVPFMLKLLCKESSYISSIRV